MASQDQTRSSWRRALPAEELGQDELRAVTLDGIDILLVRSGDAVIACPPRCPHQQEPFEDAGICGHGVLTCTKHLWQWSVPSGDPIGEAERPLLLYPTKIKEGVIYVLVEGEFRYAGDA